MREITGGVAGSASCKPDELLLGDLSDGIACVGDPRFMRPTKTSRLVADISKARTTFGFAPKVTFAPLVKMMVEADLEALNRA